MPRKRTVRRAAEIAERKARPAKKAVRDAEQKARESRTLADEAQGTRRYEACNRTATQREQEATREKTRAARPIADAERHTGAAQEQTLRRKHRQQGSTSAAIPGELRALYDALRDKVPAGWLPPEDATWSVVLYPFAVEDDEVRLRPHSLGVLPAAREEQPRED